MPTKGLKAWTNKLRKMDMPVVGQVISELNKITGCDDADVNQLAEVILRDPNLTAHVLRVANSVQYNYSKNQINTVSRAIVLIGLKGMRAICISLLVMDSLVGEQPREQLLKLIARGFHAATQARNMILKVDEKAAEEVFIAALLYHLGEMSFWASEEATTDHPGLNSEDPQVKREAMEEVLGTSFKAITRELAKHWKLGDTLEAALAPRAPNSPTVKAVVTGERLSRAANYGWDSPQLKKVLREIMEFTSLDAGKALTMVREGADQAAEVALTYGVSAACPHIPTSTNKARDKSASKPPSKILKGDPSVQLSILRELSVASRDHLDVNTIFQMVLEGMHRGIGLERVCIAFIDKHKLKAKYVLGEGTEHWRSRFLFDIGPYTENIFTFAIENGGGHWFKQDALSNGNLVNPEISRIVGKFPSFIGVLQIGERKVALFYADRWNFGGQLEEEQFESFKHFTGQAQYALEQQQPKERAPVKSVHSNSPW